MVVSTRGNAEGDVVGGPVGERSSGFAGGGADRLQPCQWQKDSLTYIGLVALPAAGSCTKDGWTKPSSSWTPAIVRSAMPGRLMAKELMRLCSDSHGRFSVS